MWGNHKVTVFSENLLLATLGMATGLRHGVDVTPSAKTDLPI
jgi:hypothetical protein